MTKFKVLKENQLLMARLGIYSRHLTGTVAEVFKSFGIYFVSFFMITTMIGAFLYFRRNWFIDVKSSLGAFKVLVAAIQAIGVFDGIGLKIRQTTKFHLRLQEIVDETENDELVHNLYWVNEQKCRKYTTRMVYYVFFHGSSLVMTMAYAIYCISVGKYDSSSWFLPFFLVLPFDESHPSGWFCSWIINLGITLSYIFTMISVTSYFMSCCFYIGTMCNHFILIMNGVKADVECNQVENNPRKSEMNRLKINKQLCSAIKIQNKIFELFNIMVDINSISILFLLPINSAFAAVSMYDIEVAISHFNFNILAWDVSCMISCLVWPMLMCTFATITSERIDSLRDIAYASNWYDYPVELRKHIILVIVRSQESVYITGMNLIRCTLEILGKILRSSCSYYLIFRRLASR